MSRGGQDQLLCIGQQPCARLGRAGLLETLTTLQKLNVRRRGQDATIMKRAHAVLSLAKRGSDLFVWIDIERHPLNGAADTRRSRRQLLPDL